MPFLLVAGGALAGLLGAPAAVGTGLAAAGSALGVASGIARGEPLDAITSGIGGLAGGLTSGFGGAGSSGGLDATSRSFAGAEFGPDGSLLSAANPTAVTSMPQISGLGKALSTDLGGQAVDVNSITQQLGQGNFTPEGDPAAFTQSQPKNFSMNDILEGSGALINTGLGIYGALQKPKQQAGSLGLQNVSTNLSPAGGVRVQDLPGVGIPQVGNVNAIPNLQDNSRLLELLGAFAA